MFVHEEIYLALGLWTVFLLILYPPTAVLLCKLDRTPKDSPRCRKCGYDLRAATQDHCPECGGPFCPRGIWPPNMPSRPILIRLFFLWIWLTGSVTLGLTAFFSSVFYDIKKPSLATTLIYLEKPHSNEYTSASIGGYGSQWQWSKNDQFTLPLEQAHIVISDDSQVLAICAFNATALKIEAPGNEIIRDGMQRFNGTAVPSRDESIEDFILRAIKSNKPLVNDEAVYKEISQLIEIASIIVANHDSITDSAEHCEIDSQAVLDEVQGDLLFQDATDLYNIIPSTNTEFLPEWSYALFPATGSIIMLLGVLLIRRAAYNRMAVSDIMFDMNPDGSGS